MTSSALSHAPQPQALRAMRQRRRPLGDPSALACTVAKAVVEAVIGGSELDTVQRWIHPDVMSQLARQRTLARRAGRRPVVARVQRARVFRVSASAAEISLVVQVHRRAHAVAMRLEESAGRWQVIAADVL